MAGLTPTVLGILFVMWFSMCFGCPVSIHSFENRSPDSPAKYRWLIFAVYPWTNSAQQGGVAQPSRPDNSDLVRAYPELQNAREGVLNGQINLTTIFNTAQPDMTAAEHKLNDILNVVTDLKKALESPAPTPEQNTAPSSIPTQVSWLATSCTPIHNVFLNSCVSHLAVLSRSQTDNSVVFVDILNSLYASANIVDSYKNATSALHGKSKSKSKYSNVYSNGSLNSCSLITDVLSKISSSTVDTLIITTDHLHITPRYLISKYCHNLHAFLALPDGFANIERFLAQY